MANLERTCILLFYYFLYFIVNLDLEKTNRLGESYPNFIFAVVNLDPIILEMRWIDGESSPNDFDEKVNRGEDLRWVGSRCPLTRALKKQNKTKQKQKQSKTLLVSSVYRILSRVAFDIYKQFVATILFYHYEIMTLKITLKMLFCVFFSVS